MEQLLWVSAVIFWLCALFIFGLAAGLYAWASRKNEPMPFWTGSTMTAKDLTNVAGYNRANLRMWMVYGVALALTGIAMLLSPAAGLIALGIVLIPGGFALVMANKKIFSRYKSGDAVYRIEI